ncbi:imidazole glycerol phosphate synthase subunit HisH [Shouchella sp. JSM 1781072]|uniref:imidazole glycerol phosphate synthase subunit HisH n=1 Tax=Bacillaceae TaxID=186817 RepID=UPI000C07432F|nr:MULTISPECIES: imidazole glycerol phosphate synthase subunit HisH [Bacillaceae]UTR05577.1 imidazole glycerol phosphate synthase subunit HisH [Alkalihalobacillus sp. LMS6]
MIGIIDYGMGNLHSVSKALERLEIPYLISGIPQELKTCDGFILPGVGAFPDAMKNLESTGLRTFLDEQVYQQKPLLGICLGMQLLFEKSTEYGETAGLSYLNGHVVHFSEKIHPNETSLKIPHMGWNELSFINDKASTEGMEEGYVYFVHSYVVEAAKAIIAAKADYGTDVPAIVEQDLVFGMQFHPEKSGQLGTALLKRFGDLVRRGV